MGGFASVGRGTNCLMKMGSAPMSPAELQRNFPSATKSTRARVEREWAAYLSSVTAGDKRENTVVQEQKSNVSRAIGDGRKSKKEDAANRGQFCCTVTLRFSDYRQQDPDGVWATLIDCLVRARRRLLDEAAQDGS